MKLFIKLTAFIIFIAGAIFVGAQTPQPPRPRPRPEIIAVQPRADQWARREIPQDGFSVEAPSEFNFTDHAETIDGETVRVHLYTTTGQASDQFIITVTNLPEGLRAFSVDKSVEKATSNLTKTGGKIESVKAITYLGCPARELAIQSPTNEHGVARIISSLKRGYLLLYVSRRGGHVNSLRALRFMDSFKFDTTGCSNSNAGSNAKPDPGTVVHSTYTNQYFGLKLAIPEGWRVQDNYVRGMMQEEGRRLIAGKDEKLSAELEARAAKAINLLIVFKYSLGTEGVTNPSFMVGAENVSDMVVTPRLYLMNVKQLLEHSPRKHEYPRDIYTETINGVEFAVMDVHSKRGERLVKQKHYTTLMKGYALYFVLTYIADEDLPTLEQAVRSVRFEK